MVHPLVKPPANRPGRVTNQINYIKRVVLRDLNKHEHVWPFRDPVDTKKLGLPVSGFLYFF